MSAIPNEFLPKEIEARSPKNEWLFRPFLSSGEPFKSLLENNPWLAPPSLKKPLEWGKGGYWETTKTGKHWRAPGYIGFRSANNFHRVDLKPGTKPLTIFIPGPFGVRKGPRSEYGIDFKTKIK